MLSGFNTNYRHRGALFHVQTEDSGVSNPHVFTHLFYGGNIIASEKRSYAELLESEPSNSDETVAAVRDLMERQHRTMLVRLRQGEHDATILERLGSQFFDDGADTAATLPPLVEPEPAPEAARQPPAPRAPEDRPSRVFGERVVSEKPLDEVVLEYLVENARRRKRRAQ